MKRTFTMLAVLLLTFAGFSQRYDDTRDVGDFHAIKAFGGVEVRLVKGEPGKIYIESNRISHQDIITEVSRGTLRIKPRTSSLFNEKSRHWYIRVEVTYDYLDEIRATAGASVISRNTVKTDEILILASTGGEIDMRLDAHTVESQVGTGAIVELSGTAKYHNANVSMGGELDAFYLECDYVIVRSTMGGVANMRANKEIEASAGLGGVVGVRGDPRYISKRTSLGGEIH